jgi:hypothetical protein
MRSKLSTRHRKFVLCTGQTVISTDLAKYGNSHIVGELHLLPRDGIKVTVCAVYERSLHVDDVPTVMPAIHVYAIGDAVIKCTLCEFRRDWEISRTSFFLLISRMYINFTERSM